MTLDIQPLTKLCASCNKRRQADKMFNKEFEFGPFYIVADVCLDCLNSDSKMARKVLANLSHEAGRECSDLGLLDAYCKCTHTTCAYTFELGVNVCETCAEPAKNQCDHSDPKEVKESVLPGYKVCNVCGLTFT